jgi:hypothetical protein
MQLNPGDKAMDQLMTTQDDRRERQDEQRGGPLPIGDVLTELFARYQARFPELQITIVHTTAEAA